LHWPFCPGVFIAVLAVLAAAVTFWEKPPRLVKVIFTFIFLILMSCEVWMMSKDRNAHDIAEQTARDTERQHFEATMTRFENLQRTSEDLKEAKIRVQRIAAKPVESLKKRALVLSENILQFLADRAQTQPQFGLTRYNTREETTAGMARESQEYERYTKETGSIYLSRFGVQVAEILGELKARGIDIGSSELKCIWAADVGNTLTLRECGVNLGLFGERLPD